MRVPRQASTKWWFLLAALLATVLTWWQAEQQPRRPAPERRVRAVQPLVDDGFVEIEIAPTE